MAPMITRIHDEYYTIAADVFTMDLRRGKWTRDFNTKMNHRNVLRQFFGMPKILGPLTKLLPKPEKLDRRADDGQRWPHEWRDVFTITAEFENFLYRVAFFLKIGTV